MANIKQGSPAKSLNSIVEPTVDIKKECDLIRRGYAEMIGDKFKINGRVYGHHHGGLYPIEGPGIHKLTQPEFKAFSLYNDKKVGPHADKFVHKLNDVSKTDIQIARDLANKLKLNFPEVYK